MTEASYRDDILAWSRAQAAALRRREAGHNSLDWDNLAEEIEDVGNSILYGCESQIENILEHMLKIEYVRSPRDVPGWRSEIRAFRKPLRKRMTRSMEAELRADFAEAVQDAVRQLEVAELITPEQVVEARERGRAWEQVLDLEWFPEPRYD